MDQAECSSAWFGIPTMGSDRRFLGQTIVRAFEIDLGSSQKRLTLATKPLILNGDDYVPLVKDLNKNLGDPTMHYTVRVRSVTANGSSLSVHGKPIYVILDTGASGMVVSQELFDESYVTARSNRERNLWGTVEVNLRTKRERSTTLIAKKPVTTTLRRVPWPRFRNAHLMVVGLAFLDEVRITVDRRAETKD